MSARRARARRVGTALALIALPFLAGCTSAASGPHRATSGPATSGPATSGGVPATASARATSATTSAPQSRFVPAGQDSHVTVLAVAKKDRGENGLSLPSSIPEKVKVGRLTTFRAAVFSEGDPRGRAVGASVTSRDGFADCGPPFLAEPGHAYAVSCAVTAATRGKIELIVARLDSRTGAVGTHTTISITAR